MSTPGSSASSAISQTRINAQALESKLAAANPTDAADSDAVSAALEAVTKVLTELNQEDLLARDAAMQAAAADIQAPLKTLGDLKDQLSAIAAKTGTMANIAADVEKVVSGCKGIFSL